MDTHPCFPLTPDNEAEYRRLNEARAQLATATDINERITLMATIGDASQQIRRIGMGQTETERLRGIIEKQRQQIALLSGRRKELADALGAVGWPTESAVWQEASKDMVI